MMSDEEFEKAQSEVFNDVALLETSVFPASPRQGASRIMAQGAVQAALSIRQLAVSGTNESVRLRAAMYLLDNVLGNKNATDDEGGAIWDNVFDAVLVDGEVVDQGRAAHASSDANTDQPRVDSAPRDAQDGGV
jgi:hypothetical protein